LKEKIKPVNTPSIKDISLKNDSEYKLKIQFDSFPVVEIKKLSFKFTKPSVKLTNYDLDKIIENMRYELGSWESSENESKIGNKVGIKYIVYGENQNRKGLEEKQESIIIDKENSINYLGKNVLISLKGYKKNATILAAKTGIKSAEKLRVEIKILDIKEKKLLNSNEKLSKVIGSKTDNISDIKKQIEVNTYKQIEEISNNYIKNKCLMKLYEENKFEIPQALLNYKTNEISNKLKMKDLEKKLVIELLIKEIIKKENIQLKQELT
jgi:FKBP-type peptidyl-prolyl cis-trans isomerase (trigger factor)